MTIQEFEKTSFGAGMKLKYRDEVYQLGSVDFFENLVGMVNPDDEDNLMWARCENVELVSA